LEGAKKSDDSILNSSTEKLKLMFDGRRQYIAGTCRSRNNSENGHKHTDRRINTHTQRHKERGGDGIV
jgi:hypothetical protein